MKKGKGSKSRKGDGRVEVYTTPGKKVKKVK